MGQRRREGGDRCLLGCLSSLGGFLKMLILRRETADIDTLQDFVMLSGGTRLVLFDSSSSQLSYVSFCCTTA